MTTSEDNFQVYDIGSEDIKMIYDKKSSLCAELTTSSPKRTPLRLLLTLNPAIELRDISSNTEVDVPQVGSQHFRTQRYQQIQDEL